MKLVQWIFLIFWCLFFLGYMEHLLWYKDTISTKGIITDLTFVILSLMGMYATLIGWSRESQTTQKESGTIGTRNEKY